MSLALKCFILGANGSLVIFLGWTHLLKQMFLNYILLTMKPRQVNRINALMVADYEATGCCARWCWSPCPCDLLSNADHSDWSTRVRFFCDDTLAAHWAIISCSLQPCFIHYTSAAGRLHRAFQSPPHAAPARERGPKGDARVDCY